jgi:hypothetical protein
LCTRARAMPVFLQGVVVVARIPGASAEGAQGRDAERKGRAIASTKREWPSLSRGAASPAAAPPAANEHGPLAIAGALHLLAAPSSSSRRGRAGPEADRTSRRLNKRSAWCCPPRLVFEANGRPGGGGAAGAIVRGSDPPAPRASAAMRSRCAR